MVMPFKEFEYLMNLVKAHSNKLERISDFFEKELCTDSWCLVNIGEDLANVICCMLADHFNCWWVGCNDDSKEKVDNLLESMGLPPSKGTTLEWWDTSKRHYDNDIEYWLYEDSKKVTIDDKDIPIETLEQFYDYLVTYCIDKKNI